MPNLPTSRGLIGGHDKPLSTLHYLYWQVFPTLRNLLPRFPVSLIPSCKILRNHCFIGVEHRLGAGFVFLLEAGEFGGENAFQASVQNCRVHIIFVPNSTSSSSPVCAEFPAIEGLEYRNYILSHSQTLSSKDLF